MTFTKTAQYHRLLMILLVIGTFATAVFAAPTVTIIGPHPTNCPTTSGQYRVCATASGGTITKVVFYKNDVPYETDTTSSYEMTGEVLGQDTYTYRARAYDTTGAFGDSNEIKFTVNTPQLIKMGTYVSAIPRTLQGPGVTLDHSDDIQAALDYLSTSGGTLFFPCTLSPGGVAVYNIKKTIRVPPNVTLQGEGSERWGACRIYWYEYGANYGPIRTDPVTNGGKAGDIPLVGKFNHSVEEDVVVFRPETMTMPAEFRIKTTDGRSETVAEMGVTGDIPLIGKFYPGENSRIVTYTPSTGT